MPWEHDNDADIRRPSYCPSLMAFVLAALLWALLACVAFAQQVPSGQPVINQALQARSLTASDTTVFLTTRGLFIGDATACNIAVRLVGDSSAVTFTNVQSGALLPFSAIQLMTSGTTCATVIALY